MHSYSLIQAFLHDLIFSQKLINKSLFQFEKFIYLKKKDISERKHIFITGLPRSGTTVLLNFIYSSDLYASLKYSNMPFIFSPNLFKFFNKKNISKKERIHADDITIDLNSPEAFDEIFFKNNQNYVKDELLNYIELILTSENKQKYLSKNNLNYKRIDLITTLMPKSIFLIPIRDPLQHSYSLLKTHLHFTKLQKKNDFIRRYMNYLGHNEFGLNHISWNKSIDFNNYDDINYWIEQWIFFYENIYQKYKSYNNCFFLIYEELSNPKYIESLIEKINLKKEKNINLNYFKNSNKEKIDIEYNENILNEAVKIYKKFKNESKY